MNTVLIDKLTEGLNPQQKQAVEMPANSFTKVVAGAGTGKTKIISKRYIKLVNDLILEGNIEKPLERLLVITFTQKAATEMKERIIKELKENNINSFGQENKISTIHSFCSEMLKRHAIEANLSPKFKLAEEKELDKIFQMIIRKIRYGEFESIDFIEEILSELNVDRDIFQFENILKLKSIGDLEDVFDSVLPIIKQVKSLGLTPEEFLKNSLKAIDEYAYFLSDFLNKKYICSHFSDIYADENIMSEDWCHYIRKSFYADESCKDLSDKELFEGLLSELVNKNNTRKSPKTVGWTPKFEFEKNCGMQALEKITAVEKRLTKVIAVIYGVYQRQLEELDLIDYDDLINKTLYILKNNKVIRSYYKKYFKHIIVDEFQDTSGAQLDLLMNLISDDAPNLTVVGDRKQSIYAFRYARMENLDILQKKIEKKFSIKPDFNSEDKIRVIKLETNYRSTEQVLEAVNAVTKNSLYLNEPLTANSKSVISDSVKFSVPEKCDTQDEYRLLESKYIAKEIVDVMKRDGLKYKNFAVLVKTHGLADFFEEQLAKYGIPSIKKVNINYFSKPIVKNIIYLFKFIQNIHNEIALIKLLEINFSDKEIYDFINSLNKFVANIDEEGILDLNISEKILKILEKNCFDEIDCSKEIKKSLKLLYDAVLEIIKNKNNLSLTAIFYKLMENYPPYSNLSGVEKSLSDIDITVFEKILADYTQTVNYTNVRNFLEYIQTISGDKNFEMPNIYTGEIDAVNLMTIHASKGLEFPYTFVAGVSNKGANSNHDAVSIELNEEFGNFGLMVNKYNGKESLKYLIYKEIYKKPRENAEAKRRFYVAVSRAEKYLNVLVCQSPKNYLKSLISKKGGTAPLQHLIVSVEKDKLSVENAKLNVVIPTKENEIKIVAPQFKEKTTEEVFLSFSKINTFNHCKRNYILKYVYGYPSKEQNHSDAKIGTIMHGLIYRSLVNGKMLDNSQLQDYLKDFDIEREDYNKILSMYHHLEDLRFFKVSSDSILAEYGFEFVYKNFIFKGNIDLVVKNSDGTVDLIDFKTNENIENSFSDYNKQMFIYKSALAKEGYTVKNLIFVNVKTDGVKELMMSDTDLQFAQKEIDNDLKNIKAFSNKKLSDFPRQNTCKYCGYNYLCR